MIFSSIIEDVVRPILIINDNSVYSSILKINIQKYNHLQEIVFFESVSNALSYLDKANTPEMIYFICNNKNNCQFKNFENYLLEKKTTVGLILIGGIQSQYEYIIDSFDDFDIEEIIKFLDRLYGAYVFNLEDNLERPESVYIELELKLFKYYVGPLTCDLFIKFKKEDGSLNYLKRYSKGDEVGVAEIEKYQKVGLDFFHLKIDDFIDVIENITNTFIDLSSGYNDFAITPSLASAAFDLSLKRLELLSIDSTTVRLALEGLTMMQQLVSTNSSLTKYIAQMKANEVSYSYSHSYLTCLLMYKVLPKFDWASKPMLDKVAFLTYFHDFSLGNNDKFIMISNSEDFELLSPFDADVNLIKNHARMSAELLRKFPSIPMGVADLIIEHHGSKNGVGFPIEYSPSISPLSMIFIVVEEFTHRFLSIKNIPSKEDIALIFIDLESRFRKTNYQKTVTILKSLLLQS